MPQRMATPHTNEDNRWPPLEVHAQGMQEMIDRLEQIENLDGGGMPDLSTWRNGHQTLASRFRLPHNLPNNSRPPQTLPSRLLRVDGAQPLRGGDGGGVDGAVVAYGPLAGPRFPAASQVRNRSSVPDPLQPPLQRQGTIDRGSQVEQSAWVFEEFEPQGRPRIPAERVEFELRRHRTPAERGGPEMRHQRIPAESEQPEIGRSSIQAEKGAHEPSRPRFQTGSGGPETRHRRIPAEWEEPEIQRPSTQAERGECGLGRPRVPADSGGPVTRRQRFPAERREPELRHPSIPAERGGIEMRHGRFPAELQLEFERPSIQPGIREHGLRPAGIPVESSRPEIGHQRFPADEGEPDIRRPRLTSERGEHELQRPRLLGQSREHDIRRPRIERGLPIPLITGEKEPESVAASMANEIEADVRRLESEWLESRHTTPHAEYPYREPSGSGAMGNHRQHSPNRTGQPSYGWNPIVMGNSRRPGSLGTEVGISHLLGTTQAQRR